MSKIDNVQQKVHNYFNYLSGPSYVRILDTPHIWGMPFGKEIMPQSLARQAEFERAIVEIVQKSRYRCDLSSLNSPDPDWVRAIMGAIDTSLTTKMGRTTPTQFRFLFGQTPMVPVGEPANYTDFKGALIRLVRERSQFWERMPEIWMGRFYRLEKGFLSAIQAKVFGDSIFGSDDDTKMTWNHTKIIAMDGTEALVGGHNLNMDLFRSYPPVHDVSVVVHGDAAYGAQLFLNRMWECGTDLFTKEYLDVGKLSWENGDKNSSKPVDPLNDSNAAIYLKNSQSKLIKMHESGVQEGTDGEPIIEIQNVPDGIRAQDLQTLTDLGKEVFQERIIYKTYDKFQDYKLSTRMLAVGKYWTGPNKGTDYQKASELMKEQLIKNAKRIIRMSQMDLISAWKKNWSDHVVCQWIMEALLVNKNLAVEVVVSPLDAGAGAEGDQYSFGSGASRTFALIKYYMMHDVDTDAPLEDKDGAREDALNRLYIAPFYFTDLVPKDKTIEGNTYKWPNLSKEGYTATLKQPPLDQKPPKKGVIGSAALSVINASGYIYNKVPSAPGNHAKIMIVDDDLYVVGSDNLYPGSLSEFNYLVEGEHAVKDLLQSYWNPLWQYSSQHVISNSNIVLTGKFKITTSTELMDNYKQFELFDQEDNFKAVQTADGHSMFFGESSDKRLFLVLEQSGNGTGWEKFELTKGLAGKVKTFAVAQNHVTSDIHIAVAMQDPSGVDKLYLCMNLSNSDLAWVNKAMAWDYKADDRVSPGNPKLMIDDIHLSESSSGDEYVVADTADGNGFVDRYWINMQMSPAWNKHPLSFNISADTADKSLMGRKKGEPVDGIYTFGVEIGVTQFVYTPLYNPFAPNSAPNPTNFDLSATGITTLNGSFATCKALSGAENATDVFLAGNGALYYMASEGQIQLAKPQLILQNEMLNALRELQASVHDNFVVVWGLNDGDEVFYLSCEISQIHNPEAWSIPLPLMKNVSEISHYIDKINGGLTIFALGAGGLITKGIQDPQSSKWKFGRIELPVADASATATKGKSFTTSIKITDIYNVPNPNTEVKLTPGGRSWVYINNVFYALSGDTITAQTDASGVLTIVEWIDGLVGTSFNVAIDEDKASVEPSNIALVKMKDLGTVSALESARITNHDGSTKSLIPTNLSSDDKKALAQSISDLSQAHDSIVKNAVPSASGLNASLALSSETKSPIDYIKVLWGDLMEGLKHFGQYVIKLVKDAASDIWHFVVEIGNKVYGFIIDTVDKVAGALKSIWEKIAAGFEDLWNYLKFLFEWKDMLLTRDVFKQTVKIFLHRIGEDIQQVKTDMDTAIDSTESLIRSWANPATQHPPLGDNNTAINSTLKDKESNPAIHSAPAELLKNHFISNVHKSSVTISQSSASSDPTWSGLTDLSGFVQSEQATITDLKNQIMALFISGTNQENPDLETILKKIIADVAIGAMDLFKMAADKILDFLTLLVYEAIEILDAPIYIPVLSDILKDLFNIELPSILDVLCLVAAVPTTIVYKVVNGHAPYESGDNTIHDKITRAKTYKELQANFKQTGDKITLDKDAEAVIFETFYLLSGLSTIINGVLVVLDEETDGGASTVLSTPKTITSVLASASVGIASLFEIPIGIKNTTMNTFSSVLSKISIATTLGFAVAPNVIAKVKGITEEGPLNALKTEINLVQNGVAAVLSFIGLVPETYHMLEIIVDGDAITREGALGIMDSTQGITRRLGIIAGFAALVDEEEISKQIIIIVQGILIGITGGIQIGEAAAEAILTKN